MKNLLFLWVILVGFTAQAQQDYNRFAESESAAESELNSDTIAEGPGNGPGDKDPPAPIDGYLSALLVLGLGMIAYYGNSRKKTTA